MKDVLFKYKTSNTTLPSTKKQINYGKISSKLFSSVVSTCTCCRKCNGNKSKQQYVTTKKIIELQCNFYFMFSGVLCLYMYIQMIGENLKINPVISISGIGQIKNPDNNYSLINTTSKCCVNYYSDMH